MKAKLHRRIFAILISLALCAVLLPTTAMAAGVAVTFGNDAVQEGETFIGGGTVTLDSDANTLTLNNVSLTKDQSINVYDGTATGSFTLIFQGENSIGSETDPVTAGGSAAILSRGVTLNVVIEEGASLNLYSYNQGGIACYDGDLNLSGSGTLESVVTQDNTPTRRSGLETNVNNPYYSGSRNITITDLNINLTSDGYGILAYDSIKISGAKIKILEAGEHGMDCYSGITIENGADVTVNAVNRGFSVTNGPISMTNSTVNVTAQQDAAVRNQYKQLTIDNTKLTTNALANYGVLSVGGQIDIQGKDTVINGTDAGGIYSTANIKISGGQIILNSGQDCLRGGTGIEITGGVFDLNAAYYGSAIQVDSGLLSITGEKTRVTAASNDPDTATVRNLSGDMFVQAYVSAEHKAGGKPFDGITADGSPAITLGEGCSPNGNFIITTEADENDITHSFFTDKNNQPVTGRLDLCCHVWVNPVFNWAEDGKSCEVTFTCTVDGTHTLIMNPTVQDGSITSEVKTPATCTEKGVTTYTVTVKPAENNIVIDSIDVTDIAALGHDYKDGKCTVCGAADPNYAGSPETGDNGNIMLWVALLFVSGSVLSVVTIKKTNNQTKDE